MVLIGSSLTIVLGMFYLVNAYIETTVWFVRQRHFMSVQFLITDVGVLVAAPFMWPFLRWYFRNDEELKPGWPGDFNARDGI